jgi:capsular exopolysaccharide synthesis family protein
VDLRDYLRTLRKRWALVLACTLLATGAAYGATALTTPTYEARTQLFVSSFAGSNVSDAYQGSLFTQQRVKSYADVVDAPSVTRPVVKELGLDMSASALAEKISTEVPLDTVLINVTVSDTDPKQAAAIADAVGKRFSTVVTDLETVDGSGNGNNRGGGSSQAPVKVSVVKPATAPETPVSPRPLVNLALGVLVGLAVGVGAAVLRETLDTSVKSTDDLADVTGRASLGVIAYDSDAVRQPLIVHADPRAPRAEAFRTLRTNLQFVDVDQPPRSVVITSTLVDEGKSTTAVNLALALAQAGVRVALVEGDLRRPRVDEYLRLEGAVGLTNVLVGQVGLDDALQSWGPHKLLVLPSGPVPPNPSELLGSQQMVSLLGSLQERADIVLVDSPPLLPVTDAAVLARACDGAVLVARHGKVHREQVASAVAALDAVDARLLGTVLSMAPTKGPDAYRHHYGYAYESTSQRPRLSTENGRRGTDPAADGDESDSQMRPGSRGRRRAGARG